MKSCKCETLKCMYVPLYIHTYICVQPTIAVPMNACEMNCVLDLSGLNSVDIEEYLVLFRDCLLSGVGTYISQSAIYRV